MRNKLTQLVGHKLTELVGHKLTPLVGHKLTYLVGHITQLVGCKLTHLVGLTCVLCHSIYCSSLLSDLSWFIYNWDFKS